MIVTDRSSIQWPFEHADFRFIQGDAVQLEVPNKSLDLIINCSTIEHLGLERYGDAGDVQADLKGMRRLRTFLKPSGVMLLTIPVGVDEVYPRLHRIYGRTRLPLLLNGFEIREQEFWSKNEANRWTLDSEDAVLTRPSTEHYYSLGCFVLSRATAE